MTNADSSAARPPLCFVLMPFGSKPDPAGGPAIDFDRIYDEAIAPGIRAAGLEPLRADEERLGGIIHEQMFRRLVACKFAVADLTTSNPNVLYELGIRHAARPRTTLTIYAQATPLPFDVGILRTERYRLGARNELLPDDARALRDRIAEYFREVKAHVSDETFIDSPLFKLVQGLHPELLVPQGFTYDDDAVRKSEELKERLRRIRRIRNDSGEFGPDATTLVELRAISEKEAAAGEDADAGVLTEIMETYRAYGAWGDMITLFDLMPKSLQKQVRVRQMRAFAYNRRAEKSAIRQPGDRATALSILEELEEEQGCSPETSGLIGRIYKSQWEEAKAAGDSRRAAQSLVKAIDAYERGFESDWRDYYPGINAITLLGVKDDEEALARKERLIPVVRYAVEQKMRAGTPTYWDYATLLELAVHAGDAKAAEDILDDVLSAGNESWLFESTVKNLRIIADTQRQRGADTAWIDAIVTELDPERRKTI